jgi:NAD(P)-dependent dehydrogenase (short-subunit alcohol dehydrogenase family)
MQRAEPDAFNASEGFDLSGRRALITGAAHGLGFAMATAFAGAGAAVAMLDVDAIALERAAQVVSARGRVCSAATDVQDSASVAASVSSCASSLGGVDVVVNCAAVFPRLNLADTDPQTYLNTLDVNAVGYMRVIRSALPLLAEGGKGRVINISSITFFAGFERYNAYVASKGAVIGMTRALAREVGRTGTTVNAIAPGAFPTRIEEDEPDLASFEAHVLEQQCIKRRGHVRDVAAAALFLASDAASFISGQTLVVDGGWMLH